LEEHGNNFVTNITVCRKPILKYIDYAFNMLSFGSWNKRKKEFNYDNMFHTYLTFRLNYGKEVYVLEKNQVVRLAIYKSDKLEKCIALNRPERPITFKDFLQNPLLKFGQRLLEYDPVNANCQKFVMAVLESSGLLTPNIINFVNQDADKVLLGYPLILARIITKVANRADTLIYGKGNEVEC